MIDWLPAESYTKVFFHSMLGMSIVLLFHSLSFSFKNKARLQELASFGNILFVLIILYMGLRPDSIHFGDMNSYRNQFIDYQKGKPFETGKDWLFFYFMYLCSKVMDYTSYFLLIDIVYITPMYLFAKKHFKSYWFFCFFLLIASFSFWTYGTNGIRNGTATSLFIMGLVFYNDRKWLMYSFFVLAFMIHNSLVIPIAAFVIAYSLRNKPKILLVGWLAAIPVSLISGGFWVNLFDRFGLFDERTGGYLDASEEFMENFSSTGFRWDFVIYSGLAIFAGWYFIIDRKLNDKFYNQLFGIYAVSNTFWILVIRAAFSNRFAYLSWFLMAPVIIYPLCKFDIIKNQYKTLGGVIFLYFAFTYFMNVIYY